MDNPAGIAFVRDHCRKPLGEAKLPLRLRQQHDAAIRAEASAVTASTFRPAASDQLNAGGRRYPDKGQELGFFGVGLAPRAADIGQHRRPRFLDRLQREPTPPVACARAGCGA